MAQESRLVMLLVHRMLHTKVNIHLSVEIFIICKTVIPKQIKQRLTIVLKNTNM